jgi:hypothetical protein
MPKKTFRSSMRSRTVAAHRAADFGADKPLYHSGDYEPKENCAFFKEKLLRCGFRPGLQINVEPLARSISRLAPDVETLMKSFAYWWSRKNAAWVEELHGPELEPRNCRERGWFDYFAVIAPLQEDHGSHAHVVVAEDLTLWDEAMLAKLGKRLGLRVNVSRNDDEWLRKKREKNPDQQHKCRVEYTVDHLRRRGSEYRMHNFHTPEAFRKMMKAA